MVEAYKQDPKGFRATALVPQHRERWWWGLIQSSEGKQPFFQILKEWPAGEPGLWKSIRGRTTAGKLITSRESMVLICTPAPGTAG
jgi:hypothetical protein